MEGLIGLLDPWLWWIVGLVLLIAELLLPGVFLMWIGIAALALGILSLAFSSFAFWVWQLQLFLFAVFSVLAILGGRKLLAKGDAPPDEPYLNRRTASLVGRSGVLTEAIEGGRGRMRLDDTVWIVEGPDLPEGTHVRVISGEGERLSVEPGPKI
ncbi:NfeD family protein [Martelella alba]|uniref:NfeD family protein n=1 Tax=Martelella alba TaxID=2590451 RepID=A0A506UBY7_9HYPH|nr:NfeD family protein [Martelella alba]TPW31098.1 NfeD family protein [Martelella alba]